MAPGNLIYGYLPLMWHRIFFLAPLGCRKHPLGQPALNSKLLIEIALLVCTFENTNEEAISNTNRLDITFKYTRGFPAVVCLSLLCASV